MTDATGREATRILHLPFGEIDGGHSTGSAPSNHKYTGQESDGETGLIYYRARHYDPQIGRFITADSIVPDAGNAQAFNRYSYVYNNPINYTDPTGHWGIKDIIDAAEDFVEDAADALHDAADALVDAHARFYHGIVQAHERARDEISQEFRENQALRIAGGIAAAQCGPICVGAYHAALAYNDGASLEDAIRAGMISAATSYIGGEITADYTAGEIGWIEMAATKGVVHGVSAVARGGSFEDGFIGSVASDAISLAIDTGIEHKSEVKSFFGMDDEPGFWSQAADWYDETVVAPNTAFYGVRSMEGVWIPETYNK